MKLTIQCNCGAAYEVDFEPVDGKLPGQLICPQCKADTTETANAMIAQQSAPPPPPPSLERPSLKLRKPSTPLAAAPPPSPEETPVDRKIQLKRPGAGMPTPESPAPEAAVVPETEREDAAHHKIRLRRPDAALLPSDIPSSPPSVGMASASPVEQGEAAKGTSAIPEHCPKHPHEPVTLLCFVCKRPMCKVCMKKTGFVCSAYCHGKAKDQQIEIPVYEGQESVMTRSHRGHGRMVGTGLFLIMAGLLAGVVWYQYFGSRPTVAFAVPIAKSGTTKFCKFVGPDKFAWLHGNELVLYDTASQKRLWAYTLPVATATASAAHDAKEATALDSQASQNIANLQERARASAELLRQRTERMLGDVEPQHLVMPVGNDLWVTSGSQLVRLDMVTGVEKTTFPITGRIQRAVISGQNLVVLSATDYRNQVLTRIKLPDGKPQSVSAAVLIPVARTPPPTRAAATEDDNFDDQPRRNFILAGENIVQFDVAVTRKNIVLEMAMRQKENPVMGGNLKVTDAAAAFEEIATDMKRSETGGKKRVDKSDYRIVLRRCVSETTVPDWVGQVVGPPRFFSTSSVDILTAGRTVYAFDKANKLLWQANLAFPVGDAEIDPLHPESGPCLVRGGTLYIADQGAMQALNAQSGERKWAFQTVGISQVQFDEEGMMYLTSTTADPDSIQYTQEVRLDRGHPVLIKLNPDTGQPLWTFQKPKTHEFDIHVSGKFVYAVTSSTFWADALKAIETKTGDVSVNFRIYRLNPKDGSIMWEHHIRGRQPQSVDFSNNQILMVWPDELQVLKFLALY